MLRWSVPFAQLSFRISLQKKKKKKREYLLEFSIYFLPFFVLSRGPTTGCRGRVLLAFEENGNSKIGVRFDKSIPDGNNLGGLCEDDHGFFCSGDSFDAIVLTSFNLYSGFSFVVLLSSCFTH